jgi:hypothetical protein
MPLDPVTTTSAKAAAAPAAKLGLDFMKVQLGRRNAPFADLDSLRGANKELDEAISVLTGKADGLPASLLAKLKGVISDRPDSFADADARNFLGDARVIDVVKAAARRTVRGEDIEEERATARELHAEIIGGDGIYGETLIEDAVAFASLTLLAHLTPADRQLIELVSDFRVEVREGFAEVIDAFNAAAATMDGRPLDAAPFDEVARRELSRLRRRRMLQRPQLPDEAMALAQRVDSDLRLASPDVRGEVYREAAALLIRANRAWEASPWIAKAKAVGADVACEDARIAISEGRCDDALRMLRDRTDALARGLLLDAIARRDGDDTAVIYFEENLVGADLTGHALQVTSTRLLATGRDNEAASLLDQATDAQIDENPMLLYLRAGLSLAKAVPPDIAKRLLENDGFLPRESDLHDDAEGRRNLKSAESDLAALARALPDLQSPDLADVVEMKLTALRLCSSDETTRELARSELVAKMADVDRAVMLAPIAKQYGVKVDWTALKGKLSKADALGGLDVMQLRAAFTIVMDESDPATIAEFVHQHRDRLEHYVLNESIVVLEIEALAKSDRLDDAKALLAAERERIGEAGVKFLETTFAELKGADTVQQRLEQFEASKSTHDLEILVEVMRHRRDRRLGDYLEKLWRISRQIQDARRACETHLQQGEELKADTFLEEIGDVAFGDPLLRTHLAWARYRQGRLREAEAELAALRDMGVDDSNIRRLRVLLLVETGRWGELEPFVQRELAERGNRTADDLVATADVARAIGSGTTMDILRAATAKDPNDARISVRAYMIATGAGLDRTAEVGEWFAAAIADKKRSGLVEKTDLNELIEHVTSSRAEAERISGMINSAAVPMFLGLGALGGTQSELVIRQMGANARQSDSRRRSVVPLFAGNRMLRMDLRPESISLDPMSILLLEQLGLLNTVIDAFEDVVLPSGTLHTFFEDRSKASHTQPSRVAQARRIRDAVSSGVLTVHDGSAPSREDDVDEEFSTLFAAAEAQDGFIVDTAPLHPPGRVDTAVDPAPYAHRLLSPVGLVAAMHSAGTVSRTVALAAETAVAGSGGTFPSEAVPPRGRPIFLANIAVQYLSDASLLHDIRAHAGLIYTSRETMDLVDREIAVAAAAEEVAAGIERVRDTLARAISEGRARVGPARRTKDELDREERRVDRTVRMSPVVSVLRDSAGINAFVCDDRGMNKYLEITPAKSASVPLLTTADLLAILHARKAIDDDAVDAARERIRRSGAGLMLVDPDEMRRTVMSCDWSVGPNAEMRAIRDSIHLPIARRVLQLPEERVWLRATSLSIVYAMRNAWIEIADDDDAERAANYLLEMLPDPAALSAGDSSPDRQAWVSEVTRFCVWGVAAMFDLRDSRVERHRHWFETRVEQMAEQRDPGAIEAVAKSLYSSMTGPMDLDDDND